ncbi:ATP-binding protein [Brevibacillus sp. SYP-B805]|uniref:ATP-binding protein n=1 Tax=Brevibacillus sp. SYP-B805 TaxID=1578199 RepID=UPI001F496514|nr:ATP-binding protein [Brevibacillus sp. SYP-B805]
MSNEAVEQFAQTLCVYQSPLERWNPAKRRIERAPFVSFETVLSRKDSAFTVTVLREYESLARKAIESTWPNVTITEIADPFTSRPEITATLELNYHYMFAIRVDRREISFLASLLETINALDEVDGVYVQTLAVPAEKDWYEGAAQAYERFKAGEMPQKLALNKRTAGRTALKLATKTVLGAISVVTELMTGEEPEPINIDGGERAAILRDGKLRSETLNKTRGDAYDVTVRIGVVCADKSRAKAIMRMVTMAFRELDGDNHLVANETDADRTWRKMRERTMGLRLQRNYMSIPEVSRLFLLPTRPLQERYHIENVRLLETGIPAEISAGGLRLGTVTHKGVAQTVYMPTDNYDELCLPRVVIGGMGSGKTTFGANLLVEAVRNGFGGLAIDPAKGQIGDMVAAALPSDRVTRIRIDGMTPFALDFCEVARSPRARNRLANAIISFFNTATDEAGAQTARYLRATIFAMQTSKLAEIMRILEDAAYRDELISKMPAGIHRSTLEDFSRMTDAKRAQVMAPIYNRLDTILGDEYLAECFASDNSIDMVALMSEKKAVVIDVPKAALGAESVDLIVNLLAVKMDLAMILRKETDQFPFFIVFDEPHQFLRSARTWRSAAVESRKWRVAYAWLFHSWEQIPGDLAEIIRSAGPHYHVFRASKKTFRELAEELAPFTVEDFVKMPRFHALNVLRVGDAQHTVFMAKMASQGIL